MVEKIVQVEADILDKEGPGVESALYIFSPSLMSDLVGFGSAAQPLETDPRPPRKCAIRQKHCQEDNCGFSLHPLAT